MMILQELRLEVLAKQLPFNVDSQTFSKINHKKKITEMHNLNHTTTRAAQRQ